MAHGAGQHEQVPDEVAVAPAVVEHEEHHTARVGQAAGHQPPQPARGHAFDQRIHGDDHQPAHRQVEARRDGRAIQALAGLQPPAQQGPPPAPASVVWPFQLSRP
ncbi:hypothetical protein G6F50_016430 [Rhizopus delemar]|uniref:Uncharacterized protein n=1 Tax=Rhizopus delemar TaxID=936053 RepID=A0A9P6XU47_9FUNG|nr:hypothetical protein G6F50_016430 [Rhizopus delemar]